MTNSRMTTLRRAFEILDLLAGRDDGLAFNEIKRACGDVAPTTMTRLLSTMIEDGLLRKLANGRYSIGRDFLRLGRKALGIQSLEELAQPILARLAHSTHESAALFQLDGERMTMAAKTEVDDSYHYMEIGKQWGPLEHDPFGLVCLEAPDGGVLAQSRMMRYGVLRVVAPVRSNKGRLIGALGITAIDREFDNGQVEHFKRQVKLAAESLSQTIID